MDIDKRELLKSAIIAVLEAEEIEVLSPFVITHPIWLYGSTFNILRENIPVDYGRDYDSLKPVFFSIIKELGGSFIKKKKAREFFLGEEKGEKEEKNFNLPRSRRSSWADYHENRAP